MSLNYEDVGQVVLICQRHQQRVRYGVLGAAIIGRAGHPNPLTQNYARATATAINRFFGGPCPAASWVVNATGFPEGYGNFPNPNYDTNWNERTPLYQGVQDFQSWLDRAAPGWHINLQSTYP
jgi:hypothetical protein